MLYIYRMLIIDRYSCLYSYSSTRTRTRTHVIIKYSYSYSYSHILQVLVLVLVLVNLVLAPALVCDGYSNCTPIVINKICLKQIKMLSYQYKDSHYKDTTVSSGLDIKHLIYMPVGHVVLKIYVPCKNFHMLSQYLFKPCKAYVHCWENKYTPRLKNHLPCRARNHKSLCALRQDLHAPGMRARLNVEPCSWLSYLYNGNPHNWKDCLYIEMAPMGAMVLHISSSLI